MSRRAIGPRIEVTGSVRSQARVIRESQTPGFSRTPLRCCPTPAPPWTPTSYVQRKHLVQRWRQRWRSISLRRLPKRRAPSQRSKRCACRAGIHGTASPTFRRDHFRSSIGADLIGACSAGRLIDSMGVSPRRGWIGPEVARPGQHLILPHRRISAFAVMTLKRRG